MVRDILQEAAERIDALTTREVHPGALVQDLDDHQLVEVLRQLARDYRVV